ncbi:MAG: 50S ribosomal protein L25 [Spirochaetaceae bacterium]|nr:MAG: 50S ribosomal protein L25 [Spirochaetaceae bacterium]
MAQTVVLQGKPRAGAGTGEARRLRREGMIPAVVYGHAEPLHCSISDRDFFHTFHTVSESTIVTLTVGKEKREVLIKDYDEDITTGKVLHIDFYEIEKGKKLRTNIAIELTGSPRGVREGGILDHNLYQIEIECLPKDIPEHLIVDISGLGLEEVLHVRDLVIPEGVRVLTNPDQTIASIVLPRVVVEEETEAEEVEVEGAAAREESAKEEE